VKDMVWGFSIFLRDKSGKLLLSSNLELGLTNKVGMRYN